MTASSGAILCITCTLMAVDQSTDRFMSPRWHHSTRRCLGMKVHVCGKGRGWVHDEKSRTNWRRRRGRFWRVICRSMGIGQSTAWFMSPRWRHSARHGCCPCKKGHPVPSQIWEGGIYRMLWERRFWWRIVCTLGMSGQLKLNYVMWNCFLSSWYGQ